MTDAFIYDAVRTPRGKGRKDGSLHEVTPVRLAVTALQAIRDRNKLDTHMVDDVVLGCVMPIGEQGADIARTAAVVAGYAESVPGVQVNRFCASGLEATNMAAAQVMSGQSQATIGGGVESMSRVPMGSDGGAWPTDPAVAMQRYPEIEKVNHVHHAGNSSGIVDGAAAILIGKKEFGQKAGLKPRARVRSFASVGSEPAIMLTGPAPSSEKALQRAGMSVKDIDLWELNEAFAAVVLRYLQVLKMPHDKINVNGGAIAMGHPLGATGAMILGTLLDELERRGLSTGLATLCVGAGMGTATIIERV